MTNEEWKPFPKQERALTITPDIATEVLFGGARGPGKTDAGIVWLLGNEYEKNQLYIHHSRYRALVLRKNYDDLVDWIDRASYLYKRYGGDIVGKPAEVRWPSGAKFRLGHLKDRASYEKYLGHEYQRILIEELTLIPKEEYYTKILGSLRSTIDELIPQVFNTTNPGGVGHLWVKQRFVDPAPYDTPFGAEDGIKRVYVPGTIEDNPALLKDANYVKYLDGLKNTDPDLYRAWRLGDWDVFAGQYFKEYRRDLHTTSWFEPKSSLTKFGGVDWGIKNPFVFLGLALEKTEYIDEDGDSIPFNRLWVYKEIAGTEKTPFVWARKIKKSVNLDEFDWIRADPSMFHRKADGSRSIADQFQEKDVLLQPANNDRVGGWTAIKNWLSTAPDGLPYLIISEQCHGLVTTLPSLVHDENDQDDIDTDGEDHWADALRYATIHIRWIDANLGTIPRPQAKKLPPRFVHMVDPSRWVVASE